MSNNPADDAAAATLVELLRRRAQLQPDAGTYTFPIDRETTAVQLVRQALGAATDPAARHALLMRYLHEQAAAVLRVAPDRLELRQPLISLGLDSLATVELKNRLETDLGLAISLNDLLAGASLTDLAAELLSRDAPVVQQAALAPFDARVTEHPLSSGQAALLFLDRLAASAAYSIARAVRIESELDVAALGRAFQALVRRHAALRTTFATVQGAPIQRVHADQALYFRQIDAASWSAVEIQRRLDVEAQRPFDLAHGPLLRVTVFSLAHEHLLLLAIHHSVADLWSLAVLVREVGLLYAGELAGQAAVLPALELEYSDYARWQTEMLAGPIGAWLWAYWQQTLAGELPVLQLPTDRPRPAVQSYRGAAYPFRLPQEQAAMLKSLAGAAGVTLYMLLLAAYQVFLFRYSGQQELIVGSPTAGRDKSQLAGLVGYFVNLLALHERLSGRQPFRALLDQVRHTVLAAFAHQALPFPVLVERLQPRRDAGYSPIFQTVFVWQQAPHFSERGLATLALEGDAVVDIAGLRVAAVPLATQYAQFDLTLTMAEDAGALVGALEYSSDLFDATTIARMAEHWRILLASIVAEPSAPIAWLPLLSDEAARELIAGGRAAQTQPQHNDVCLHELFEAQAARTPDAVALVFDFRNQETRRQGDKETTDRTTNDRSAFSLQPSAFSLQPSAFSLQLTYSELNRRANQLAHRLRALGVGPETRVALCLERSIELVVGVLGVLKAGGAYVPLDPAYPPARLDFMLEDAQVGVLVTIAADKETRGHGDKEINDPSISLSPGLLVLQTVVNVRADWPAIAGLPDANLRSGACADNLAYVIYTSGSSGQPKGTLISHANVARLFAATNAWFGFCESDIWTLFHSYAFDFSVWELWGALCYGGRLVVVPYWASRAPQTFYELLQTTRVTMLNQTPSAFRQLMRVDSTVPLRDLRRVIFGGEALELQSLTPWFARYGDQTPQLVNMYGITETTVHVTYRPLRASDAAGAVASVIGSPLPDMSLALLDPLSLQPVPIGVPGEICIGGAGLARGYLNRPDLTAERFVPNPFARDMETRRQGDKETPQSAICNLQSAIGGRLYKTGDLARRLPDGELVYLGRIDTQVKIRGHRVELDEIALALRAHPAISDAVVLARVGAGAKRASSSAGDDAAEPSFRLGELRRFLKSGQPAAQPAEQQLVAYVVPHQGSGIRDQGSGVDEGRKTKDQGADFDSSSVLRPSSLIDDLRRFLKERLPDYMLPAAFVVLDALPLTPNGKLDRRALPTAGQARPDVDAPFVAPRTPTEQALAAAWQQVLGIAPIGIDDNYFALGGDSIRSIQVQSLAQEHGLRFALPDLFQFQTIRELAQVVEPTAAGAALRVAPFSFIAADDRQRLPAELADAYPLARIQAGVIFHSQLLPDSPMYRDIFLYRLRAPLDRARFQLAVQRLVDRHAIFRTAFQLTGFGEPLQLVHTRVDAPLQLADLRALAAAEQTAWQAAWIEAEKANPFSWTDPPLIRFFVHQLTNDIWDFVISFHDAILDGWSTALMLVEILQEYAALLAGSAPLVPPPPIGYCDYVALERQAIDSQACQQYWSAKLSDWTLLRLPRRAALSEPTAPQMAVLDVAIAPDVSDGLQQLARLARVSLKHVLLAAHLRVMRLLGGQPDVLTGLESNGRLEEANGEQTIGIHLNSLPFRQRLAGGTWLELVQQTFETERELWPFRRYPYAEIQRRAGGRPLFETCFNYTHFHVFKQLQALPGIAIIDAKGFGQTHFTLKAEFNQDPFSDRVQLDLECDLNELPRDQLALIGGYYARTLTAMAQAPLASYADATLLSAPERQQLLVEWNDTSPGFRGRGGSRTARTGVSSTVADSACLHELFVAQAERTPDAVALVFDFQDKETGRQGDKETAGRTTNGDSAFSLQPSAFSLQLTYQDLNRRANQLAWHLLSIGVVPGALVGLCVERTPAMLVGLLGILKAGCAYVPLDPSYPRERLAFMLEDAQVALLITATTDEGRGTKDEGRVQPVVIRLSSFVGQLVDLCADWPQIAQNSDCDPPSRLPAEAPAYVIYTSGSTGRPKGAIGRHRGAVNRLRWMWATYPFVAGERCCQKTSLSFVDAVWEVFGPLLHGIPTVIIPDRVVLDAPQLVQTLAAQRVTRIVLVPALLRALLATGDDLHSRLRWLTHWVASGEALPVELAERFWQQLPGRILLNLYGSSEVSADVTAYAVPARTATASIAIGRPIANTQIYILDSDLQPTPIGVAGEVFVGGAGLALGYLNRPALTAERFVPNPFAEMNAVETQNLASLPPDQSSRLYQTGDLARYRPDGTLEFLGRIDQQAKIRGYRVELGEIETVLRAHPGLLDSAVVLRDSGDDQQLVAYVVADTARAAATKIDFSLFYFAADESTQDKYRLYIETAKFADQHGFSAVWTPERHFHKVGGLYPNPATLSAALAMVTDRIQLRAGSVVLPLQHPLRVAEEWSVVDNLSNGRVGIACVSGWVPNDFAFFPEHFADKRAVMFQGLEAVRKLWRGEALPTRDGVGNPVELRVFPRPVQPELPIWLTCNRAPELFEKAGELGVNVLTALLNQTLEEAAAHIQLYRDARARHGHDPAAGRVTMMLHTYVADTAAEVLQQAREPFCRYMLSHVGLIESWLNSLNIAVDVDRADGLADLVAFAFERYYQTAALIGTPETCLQMIERLHAIGVDEVGCLIDFGIDLEQVMQSLQRLSALREYIKPAAAPGARALRSFLKARLPDYMLPSSFVFVDALPRTPSGKLDRQGLSFAPTPELPAPLVPPQTPTEATLAAIWCDVLQLERVGIHDNFFEIGGHSLKATQLMAHVRQRFGVELAVQHVFSAPTINNMAAVVDDALLAQASAAQLNHLLDLLDDMDEESAQAALRG